MTEWEYKRWNVYPLRDYAVKMSGVIHVGAHVAQEYEDYIHYGIKNIVFFEPLKSVFRQMVEGLPFDDRVRCFNMALGNMTGEVEMYVETANRGQSSSILEPGTHLDAYPNITFDTKEVVKIDKLDNVGLDMSLYDTLNIDVQGYELEVLKGATECLKHINVIFTEVNTGEVYKGCAKMVELDDFLSPYGFVRIYTHVYDGINYGDAIYIKR